MLRITASLFLLGISFGTGPCLASCGPLFLSYIAGSSKNIPKSIVSYLLFSLARILVYVLLGILVYASGRFITENIFQGASRYIFILGGGFVIFIGILMALGKNINIAGCHILHRKLLEKDAKSMFIFGLIIGLLPCAPLFALFSYIGLISKSWFLSAIYAFSFGLGTIFSPLLILTVFAGLVPRALAKFRPRFSRIFNFACSLIIIFLGAQLLRKGY